MVFLTLILTLITIKILLCYMWNRKVSYWKVRGIPFIPPELPFGNIKDLVFMRKTLGQHYNDIYRKFEGEPFCGVYQFWKPALLIRDPELIKTVFVKEFQSFHDNHYFVNPEVDPILGLNPFNSKGDKWLKSRKILTPSLTVVKIKSMVPRMFEVCNELINYVKRTDETYIEAHEMMCKYSTDIIGSCAYGIQRNSFNDPNNDLRQISKAIFDSSYKGNIALLCALYAPKLGNLLKFKILSEEASQYFVDFVRTTYKYRVMNNIQCNDYLQTLIDTNEKAKAIGQKFRFNDVELAAHCMTFFLDGFETTAILLSFIVYELSINQEIQTAARNEIKLNGEKIEDFDFDTVYKLDYLHMVVMEGLRKHPPGTTMARTCTKKSVLKSANKEVHVEEGVPVILPMYSIHNDKNFFPNPEIFDPLRFTEENQAKRPQFAHFPFGGGPRSCPGHKFALTMVKLGIISLLLNFRLIPKEIPCGTVVYNPMNTFFHTALHGLWIKYVPINSNEK
ncbi:probable cytochrome P450 6a13 isoform X3 [Rhodnius prolixus]|uniref:probable cytochrome P450 6a13 isoform X2 n=1 Tax=Rhodnius prolixus TaxID=13249 RepID=UPI003D18EF9C